MLKKEKTVLQGFKLLVYVPLNIQVVITVKAA